MYYFRCYYLTLDEAQPVFTDPNHQIPDSTGAKKISNDYRKIRCQIGDFDVYELKSEQFVCYFVKDKDGVVVAYSKVLVVSHPYVQTKMVFTTIKGKGIIPGLYTFLVRDYGLKLLSDYLLSTDGLKLWKNLPKSAPTLHIRVADTLYGTEYDLSDVKTGKCVTKEDKVEVLLPEYDKREPPKNRQDLVNNPNDYQRFIYVAEGLRHIVDREQKEKGLSESIIKKPIVRGPVPFPPACYCNFGIMYEFGDEE